MPDCYLHIGTHKSGSTTIQGFLSANRKQLRSLGYYLPNSGAGHSGMGHTNLAREFWGGRSLGDAQEWKALATELKGLSGENIIISSETFEHLIRKPAVRQEICLYMRELGYRVKAIVYIRQQDNYINSSYATQVKLLVQNNDFRSFLDSSLESNKFDYWRSFSGLIGDPNYTVVARPFNRTTIEAGLCRDFLLAIGLRGEQIARFEEGPRRNVSPGAKVIEAALRLKRAVEEKQSSMQREARNRLGRYLIKLGEARGWSRESFYGLDGADRERIRDHFSTSNRKFARLAWDREWDDVFGDEPQPKPLSVFRYEEASAEEKQEFDAVLEMAIARIRPRSGLADRARGALVRAFRRIWGRRTGVRRVSG